MNKEFLDRDCQVLGASTDSEFVHRAWRENHSDLTDLPFPMLADVKRELCAALGILDPNEGVAQRATYLVDPQGIVRYVSVYDLSVGRNPQEVLARLMRYNRTNFARVTGKKVTILFVLPRNI